MNWSRVPSAVTYRRAALAGAVAICAAIPSARAENFTIRYAIKLIGVPLGTATFAGTIEPTSYRVEAAAKLTGIAEVVSNAKGAATASGLFVQGRVAPNGFATTSANSQMTRTIRIAMAAGNVRASEITPPFDSPPDRIPVTEAQKMGVIDPLSGLLLPVPMNEAVVGPAACNRGVPIFDGWTRFDIGLGYTGAREVHLKGYSGPVAVCSVRYIPISGHRDRPVVRFMAENRKMETWLAPLGSSHLAVPLRSDIETMIGMLTIEATEVSVLGPGAAQR